MGIIKNEHINTWRNEIDEIFCDKCATNDEREYVLTYHEIDAEEVVICDGCRKRIQ